MGEANKDSLFSPQKLHDRFKLKVSGATPRQVFAFIMDLFGCTSRCRHQLLNVQGAQGLHEYDLVSVLLSDQQVRVLSEGYLLSVVGGKGVPNQVVITVTLLDMRYVQCCLLIRACSEACRGL